MLLSLDIHSRSMFFRLVNLTSVWCGHEKFGRGNRIKLTAYIRRQAFSVDPVMKHSNQPIECRDITERKNVRPLTLVSQVAQGGLNNAAFQLNHKGGFTRKRMYRQYCRKEGETTALGDWRSPR